MTKPPRSQGVKRELDVDSVLLQLPDILSAEGRPSVKIEDREVITTKELESVTGIPSYLIVRSVRDDKLEGRQVGRDTFVFYDGVERWLRLYAPSDGRTNIRRKDRVESELELGLINDMNVELPAADVAASQ